MTDYISSFSFGNQEAQCEIHGTLSDLNSSIIVFTVVLSEFSNSCFV